MDFRQSKCLGAARSRTHIPLSGTGRRSFQLKKTVRQGQGKRIVGKLKIIAVDGPVFLQLRNRQRITADQRARRGRGKIKLTGDGKCKIKFHGVRLGHFFRHRCGLFRHTGRLRKAQNDHKGAT